ncbi:hypothetical protein SEA_FIRSTPLACEPFU_77 [Mycobacterium phage FirstPlacePfu]|uniref:Uncharacterized protein n=1 Tax=Mycobacterium phage FirstPlacePfu TaxID=2572533 RepID=A0A4D6T7W4_9CAUD|nr:hypothetical protein I5J46_gp77 [Mycobacterium phage FirstPlacePfu]QCG77745.1 hypothetical protein SEA_FIRSTPLACEPFU_77 [Mycobacterium phage FirstPlacePfu]
MPTNAPEPFPGAFVVGRHWPRDADHTTQEFP